ncbi:hypothetical protein EK21DRAFT_95237 [Setomelanomma holmii]|uniref:Uncharacterized protein n=1 Tax=Setomelanomma holmii TaxID=210430 RepID=A0A9P4LFD4_9PLEO|nr:hypothetical protein EK21DRAFT_95237 [Setomelanomma holmii]
MKEAEGCCIERATESDYIHNHDDHHPSQLLLQLVLHPYPSENHKPHPKITPFPLENGENVSVPSHRCVLISALPLVRALTRTAQLHLQIHRQRAASFHQDQARTVSAKISHRFFRLMTVNQQVRAEFHDMLLDKLKIIVPLRNCLKFFDTFFLTSSNFLNLARSRYVQIAIGEEARAGGFFCPGKIPDFPFRPWFGCGARPIDNRHKVAKRLRSQLLNNLELAFKRTPRCILPDIKSEYLEAIEYHIAWANNEQNYWYLTIKKKSGCLMEKETEKVQAYCDALLPFDNAGGELLHGGYVTVKVVDFQEKQWEEWKTDDVGDLIMTEEEYWSYDEDVELLREKNGEN